MMEANSTNLKERPADGVPVALDVDQERLGNRSNPSLAREAVHASLWTIGGYISAQMVRLVSSLVLTRLLFPEAFGMMALVNTFLQGLTMFSDIGIGPCLIQNPRGAERTFQNTAWTIQIARGLTLAACACLIARPLSEWYGEPMLGPLLSVAGLTAAIAGFNSTALFIYNRDLALRRLTMLEFLSQVGSVLLMLVLAWWYRSVWVLVIGGLAASLIKLTLSHVMLATCGHRLEWSRPAARALTSFGKWIFVSTLLTFLSLQADRLILGKYLPMGLLGVYGIAYFLADQPRQLSKTLSAKVLFPAISRRADLARAELRERLVKRRGPVLLGAAVVVGSLVSFGDLLIDVLYDERYVLAGPIVPILALGLWPRMLDQTLGPALLALRVLQYNPLGSLLRLLVVTTGIVFGFRMFGVLGAVVAVALGDVPNYLADLLGLWRHGLQALVQDLKMTLVVTTLTIALVGARMFFGFGHPFQQAHLLLSTTP